MIHLQESAEADVRVAYCFGYASGNKQLTRCYEAVLIVVHWHSENMSVTHVQTILQYMLTDYSDLLGHLSNSQLMPGARAACLGQQHMHQGMSNIGWPDAHCSDTGRSGTGRLYFSQSQMY